MLNEQSYVCSCLGLRFCPTGLPICLLLCQYHIVFFFLIVFIFFYSVQCCMTVSARFTGTQRGMRHSICALFHFFHSSFGVLSQKALPTASQPFILRFSCVSFVVLTFIFRLMIHCESTFIYEVKVQFHMSQWNHPVV